MASSLSRSSERLIYSVFWVVSVGVSLFFRDVAWKLVKELPSYVSAHFKCEEDVCFGNMGALRISAGTSLFFLMMALLTVGIKSTGDARAGFHRGWFVLKVPLWIAITAGLFFVPNTVIDGYGQVARVGGSVFIVVQLVLLLEFSYNWNEKWVAKGQGGEKQGWLAAVLVAAAICYVAAFALCVCMYLWFTTSSSTTVCEGSEKSLNVFFITFTGLLGVTMSAATVHPRIEHGAILPAAVATLYSTYVCLSAMMSLPPTAPCNNPPWNKLASGGGGGGASSPSAASSPEVVLLGSFFTMLVVLYNAIRTSSSSEDLSLKEKLVGEEVDEEKGLPKAADTEEGDKSGGEGEEAPRSVEYNYSFFHVVFAAASMYVVMVMVNWDWKGATDTGHDIGWNSVWFKMASQWVGCALYFWSLFAPYLFPNRDFGV